MVPVGPPTTTAQRELARLSRGVSVAEQAQAANTREEEDAAEF